MAGVQVPHSDHRGERMYQYHAVVNRVVDGDTVDLRIDLGFKVWVEKRCRLLGVDTPETRTRDEREKRLNHAGICGDSHV